jgi:hypothetical protein
MDANVRHPKRLLCAYRQRQRRSQHLTARFTLSAIQFNHSRIPFDCLPRRTASSENRTRHSTDEECLSADRCGKKIR